MTSEEIFANVHKDIDSIVEFVETLEGFDGMMNDFNDYFDKHFTTEFSCHSVLTSFAIADISRCCAAMKHEIDKVESWEAEFAMYGMYRLKLPSQNYYDLCDDPQFKSLLTSQKNSSLVNRGEFYEFNLIRFFEDYGYITAELQYLRMLSIMSTDIALLDEELSSEENIWIKTLNLYIDDLEEKSEKNEIQLGSPIRWLNGRKDKDDSNNSIIKLSFDADCLSSYKLRRLIDKRFQSEEVPIFVLKKTDNPFMFKVMISEEEFVYAYSSENTYSNYFTEYGWCIALMVLVDKQQDPWNLYFRKHYEEDHLTPEDYEPYKLNREYVGELSVDASSSQIIRLSLASSRNELGVFRGKIVNHTLTFNETRSNNLSVEVQKDLDNRFLNFLHAALRNNQDVFGYVQRIENGSIVFKVKVSSF